MKLSHGVGFNDNKHPATTRGKTIKEYDLWLGMLARCYSEKVHAKQQTYIGCTVSDNFKSYSYFYEWCQSQVGFFNHDENCNAFELDKDLLFKGNKVYSEDTCVFIPKRINTLLNKNQARRGKWPIGVTYSRKLGKFTAKCNNGDGRQEALGLFNSVSDAFEAYKTFKENIIRQAAFWNEHKIDKKAYDALMAYTVDLND